MINESQLRRYARLILEIGVNLKPGQGLAVNAFLAHAGFVSLLADEAYCAGAALVDVWYWDPHVKLARLRHAAKETLAQTPEWLDHRYHLLAQQRGALINLVGNPEPDLLRDADEARAGLDRMPALASRFDVQSRNAVQWCIAAVASAGWAEQIFGQRDEERLWRELALALRLDSDDPADAWRARMSELNDRCAQLEEYRFDSLHYLGPGTDLHIGLPKRHRWGTALLRARSGIEHLAALPSEEIFTTPDPSRTEGTICASKPLAVAGTIVDGLELRFSNGRVHEVRARRGADVVRANLMIDDGASRLGEVALVDDTSPLQQSGVLFYETLLDESAASHIAWGGGIPDGHADYDQTRPETLEQLPINRSATHVDFMVGSPDLIISGVHRDGSKRVILDGERWVL